MPYSSCLYKKTNPSEFFTDSNGFVEMLSLQSGYTSQPRALAPKMAASESFRVE